MISACMRVQAAVLNAGTVWHPTCIRPSSLAEPEDNSPRTEELANMATMAVSTTVFEPAVKLEVPSAHLPCSTIVEYKKGQAIYHRERPSTGIHLIIEGTVKVCRLADDGSEVVVDLYRTDD